MSEPFTPPPPTAPPPAPPRPPGVDPRAQVQGPAIGLIITAIVGAIWALFSLLGQLMGFGMAGMESLGSEYNEWAQYAMGGALGIVSSIIGLAVAGFILWAALQMKELRNWMIAMVASILAMIPCISPCCIIGLPIGIWALIVLLKPEVKAAFTS